jgi:flagellar motor switch protein FliN/FliY
MPESMKDGPVSYEEAAEELQYFWDVPFGITVQLGDRHMKIRDILQLHVGSVISLSKSAGENVDILINGRIVAFGEVMELEGSTGIRITELNVSE